MSRPAFTASTLLLLWMAVCGCATKSDRWVNPNSSSGGAARYAVFPFAVAGRARMTAPGAADNLTRLLGTAMSKAGYDLVSIPPSRAAGLARDGVVSEDAARTVGRDSGATVAVFGNVIWYSAANARHRNARVAFVVRGIDIATGMVLWRVSAGSDPSAGLTINPGLLSDDPRKVAAALVEKAVQEIGEQSAGR